MFFTKKNFFRENNEGEYYCVVTQCTKDCTIEVRSNIVVCTLLDSLPEFVQNLQPKLLVPFGAEIKLEVEIYCRSNYKIEWIKQNQILEGKNDCFLVVSILSFYVYFLGCSKYIFTHTCL